MPGFPDFPDCWTGAPSQKGDDPKIRNQRKQWKASKAKAGGQQRRERILRQMERRLRREAVNRAGTAKKALRQQQKVDRQARRREKVEALKKRRETKRAMGSLCLGLSSLMCD